MTAGGRTVFLVSCVSAKRSTPTPARDLYCSDWFLKATAYVGAQSRNWFILSAKYGLVRPDEVLAPYEMTLNDMSAEDRRIWARKVLVQLRPQCRVGDLVVILAGERYREHLVPTLREWGCDVHEPLAGMRLGEQKRWLKTQHGRPWD